MRQLPADAYAVKRIGIDLWQEGFFWPVSDRAYFSMLDAIWGRIHELFQGLEASLQDIVLADMGFLDFLAQCLHAAQIRAFCERHSCRVITGSLSEAFYRPRWDGLAQAFEWNQSGGKALAFQVRRVAKRIRFNAHLPWQEVLKGLFRRSEWWGLGSFSQLKADYVRTMGRYCDHHYVQTLLPKKLSNGEGGRSLELAGAVRRYLSGIEKYCEEQWHIPMDAGAVAECWVKRLEGLLRIYEAVAAKKETPGTLLLTECAAPLHRAAALALKRKGCRIVGFGHGNDMGNFRDPVSAYMEYSHCDEYVCPTAKAAESHLEKHRTWKIEDFEGTRFVSADTSFYRGLFERGKREAFPRKIESVMLVGYPMNASRYAYSSGDFFLFQMDLELRVARFLKHSGYRVVYKVHPERRQEVEGIFDGLADRILSEPFEKVCNRVDAYFFGCMTTSTFGFALCMNRPIYVIDLPSTMWNPEAYSLLSRRCVMVPARFDEDNRIQFSEEHLLQGLKNLPEEPDFSYLENFMFASPPPPAPNPRKISHIHGRTH